MGCHNIQQHDNQQSDTPQNNNKHIFIPIVVMPQYGATTFSHMTIGIATLGRITTNTFKYPLCQWLNGVPQHSAA